LKSRKEVQDYFGITRKTLIGYKEVGLLYPTQKKEGDRWYYDDEAVRKLTAIRVFTEAGFSRKKIKRILDSPNIDFVAELENVIHNLEDKRKRIEETINIAKFLQIGAKMPKSVLRAGSNIDLVKIYNGKFPIQAIREDALKLGEMDDEERTQIEEGMPMVTFLMSIGSMKGKPYDSELIKECAVDYNRIAAQAFLQEMDEDSVKEYGESSDYEKAIWDAIFGVLLAYSISEVQEFKAMMEQQCGEGVMEYIIGALEAYGNTIWEEEESFTDYINELRKNEDT